MVECPWERVYHTASFLPPLWHCREKSADEFAKGNV
jgi:hypothetical protein